MYECVKIFIIKFNVGFIRLNIGLNVGLNIGLNIGLRLDVNKAIKQ